MVFSDLFMFNKGVLHAYHGIVLSAEGYDIKNQLVLIPIHQSILKSYSKRKDNRKQSVTGERRCWWEPFSERVPGIRKKNVKHA